MRKLLVIDHNRSNWFDIFKNATLSNGEEIQVDQADWRDISLTAYSKKGAVVELSPKANPIKESPQGEFRKSNPDFLLFRKINKNLLYGFQFADIPSVNTLESILMNQERSWMYGGLVSIQKRLGQEEFPLIEQIFYPSHIQMRDQMPYPLVVKVGAAHAGFGKMKILNRHNFEDFTSVMALYSDYITAEPFIEVDYDFRIQKIGNHYRGLKRKSSSWKANVGASVMEEMPLSDKYKRWADECSKLFGGMDILAIDALKAKDGSEYIIELNDCQIGFPMKFKEEDMKAVREVVISRMESN